MSSEIITITQEEFQALQTIIKSVSGINLSDSKHSFVVARLLTRMKALNCQSFTDYLKVLSSDSKTEVSEFVDRMTTNETYFFREDGHFAYLIKEVIPQFENSIRIWSCACSTGDEPYTISILLNEHFQSSRRLNFKILATDISSTVLKKAAAGIYGPESLRKTPDHYRKSCFKSIDGDRWEIEEKYKRDVTFKKVNLLKDKFPLKEPVDVIFCRNVMIYFDQETREQVIKRLYDSLSLKGYLFLGHSESLNSGHNFQQRSHGVFQKRGVAS